MRVRMWLGPAGSGKTHRCLAEIREALRSAPEGPPLILVAPRQMTFQLERQLLSEPTLCGYTRLQVVSFERLCFWLWEAFEQPLLRCLSAEGRVMAFRALLGRLRGQLKVFHASARWAGFARELSEAWVECKRHRIASARLEELAREVSSERLAGKLHDLALLTRAYEAWLEQHGLVDVQTLGERVTAMLRERSGEPWIEGIWVDGFAELAPQEIALLAELGRHCRCLTVTFCLDPEGASGLERLSPWWVVGEFKKHFEEALQRIASVAPEPEWLPPRNVSGRFDARPELFELERAWARGGANSLGAVVVGQAWGARPAVRLVACETPLAEAAFVAREIWKFVRAGGRFRDVLVLVRDLEVAHAPLRRVFAEYEIPHYWDRRESVAHHPLVVLTRSALRLVGRNWRSGDWFAVIKSGLLPAPEGKLDALENHALANGWQGRDVWLGEVAAAWYAARGPGEEQWWEAFVQPWKQFDAALEEGRGRVRGAALVAAIRELWDRLGVERRLEQWAAEGGIGNSAGGWPGDSGGAVHETVWEQMQAWLEDLELAFGEEALEWSEWLPIVEAGLGGLTVGVIPPALDQVLVGAVHRSRQSEARLVFLLGWNEGVFPARPARGPLLTEAEWAEVAGERLRLYRDPLDQRALEEHFAYLACTRAREQLIVTWCRRDAAGRVLNPSPFYRRLRQLFPAVPEEEFAGPGGVQVLPGTGREPNPVETARELVHVHELWPWLLRVCGANPERARALPEKVQEIVTPFQRHARHVAQGWLAPGVATGLYGSKLRVSVTQLERFAACPFQFFVWGGLLAREREVYEAGAAEVGSFQHEVLAAFHRRVCDHGQGWKRLEWDQARRLLREAAEEVRQSYRAGLFGSSERRRLLAERLVAELERFLGVVLYWMQRGYQFEPEQVEWRFGDDQEPGWRLSWPDDRVLEVTGRLDRVDVRRTEDGSGAWAVVMDYKTGRVDFESALVWSGVDLQLRVYLSVVRELRELRRRVGVDRLQPVGAFYVPLRPRPKSVKTRAEAESGHEASALRQAYQHQGLFDAACLEWLEGVPGQTKGEQFAWRRNQDGRLHKGCEQALEPAEFAKLLAETEGLVRSMAERIWQGDVRVDPYEYRGEVACERCECQAICRIDRARHRFRKLRSPRA
ncbi:MAG: PD-(D/E)XK nuclease family protein [Limisphaera sp.]